MYGQQFFSNRYVCILTISEEKFKIRPTALLTENLSSNKSHLSLNLREFHKHDN